MAEKTTFFNGPPNYRIFRKARGNPMCMELRYSWNLAYFPLKTTPNSPKSIHKIIAWILGYINFSILGHLAQIYMLISWWIFMICIIYDVRIQNMWFSYFYMTMCMQYIQMNQVVTSSTSFFTLESLYHKARTKDGRENNVFQRSPKLREFFAEREDIQCAWSWGIWPIFHWRWPQTHPKVYIKL